MLQAVLVLAGLEFIFFSVAVFWRCAEYRVGNVETFLLLVSRANRAEVFPAARLERRLGVHRKSGGNTAMTPTEQRDVPCHVSSCSVYKLGAEGGRGDLLRDGICPPKSQ